MKAVISALKNPIADDDDVEIESSPPPYYLGFADGAAGIEALSHSTPMLTDTNYQDFIPGTPEARHVRQGKCVRPCMPSHTAPSGSLPHMRRSQRRPLPPQSMPYAQFLMPPEQTWGTSSVESTPPPLPKRNENIQPPVEDVLQQVPAAITSQDQTPSPVASSTPAATSPKVAEQSNKLQELSVSTEYPTKLASKLAAKKRKQSSGDVLESLPTEVRHTTFPNSDSTHTHTHTHQSVISMDCFHLQQPKATQLATAPASAAITANSKDVAYKMKQLANQLSHGQVAIESDASGVKIRYMCAVFNIL